MPAVDGARALDRPASAGGAEERLAGDDDERVAGDPEPQRARGAELLARPAAEAASLAGGGSTGSATAVSIAVVVRAAERRLQALRGAIEEQHDR